ncbi:MAG: hypothetical protein GY856_25535, partial [bacterium]|nr:hypothetical protein [bacterium]
WGPCLAIAIILAVAADAAARTWRLQWPLVLYTAAGGFAALAFFMI